MLYPKFCWKPVIQSCCLAGYQLEDSIAISNTSILVAIDYKGNNTSECFPNVTINTITESNNNAKLKPFSQESRSFGLL